MPSQPTNVFTPATQIGRREDLLDFIKNISPTERPFLSNVRTGPRASAVKVEYQTDALAAAADNAALDGQEFSAPAVTPTVRLGSYLQTFHKDVVVAQIANEIDTAGRRSEISYQMTKKGQEMLNDAEHVMTQNYGSTAGAAASARHLASTESWITTNVQKAGAADGTSKGWQSGITTAPIDSSTVGAVSTTLLKAAIKGAWSSGGNPQFILVGPTNKQTMSGFGGVATLYKDIPGMQQAIIVDAADYYVSDFGQHMIVPSRFCRGRTVQVLDLECWEVRYLRRMTPVQIAKSGDSTKRMLIMDVTLLSKAENANAKIVDTNG